MMSEKEPKFINQEAEKSPIEDKVEAKELEKSPAEMLRKSLPLVWEEALRVAQEKGFATPEGIKKRIDLAKKYNLEIEHFFYSPEQLKKEIPTQELIKKTAKESEYIRELIKEFSIQSNKPVLCIFNARGGTIYSYGADNLNTCLNSQYETDEAGEAILDDKGYPVPRKTAPMTVAAEDELARVEAAMEELER